VTGEDAKRPLWKRLARLCKPLPNIQATLTGVPHAPSNSVLYLYNAKWLLLESERTNGEPVPTREWFAAINETIFIRSEAASGTVRRIERRPVVKVATCDFRGIPINDYIECMARIVAEREPEAETASSVRPGHAVVQRAGV
jgi:PPOX class probable F420-dependent enzyme